FRFLKAIHRLPKAFERLESASGALVIHVSAPGSLRCYSAVVVPFVFSIEAREQPLRLLYRESFIQLVGQREDQDDERGLMIRVDSQNILTNAFRLNRLIQKSVTLCLSQSLRNSLNRN